MEVSSQAIKIILMNSKNRSKKNMRRARIRWILTSLIAVLIISSVSNAEILTKEDYLTPPKEIENIITAPRYNNQLLENLSPDGVTYVVGYCDSMPQLKYFAKPFLSLAQLEIDTKANRHRGFTKNLAFQKSVDGIELFNRLELFNWQTGKKINIKTPKNAFVSNPTFSPDGKQLAYFAHFDDATHIYIADLKTGKSKKITKTPVLATHVKSFKWTDDSQNILTVLLPDNRPAPPAPQDTPIVDITNQGFNPTSTYQFLLKTKHDKDLLEYYSTGQLALINIKKAKQKKIGKPEMILNASISPDAKYLTVKTLQKPFSTLVSLSRFGYSEQLYDIEGNVLAQLEKVPLHEFVSSARSNLRDYHGKEKTPTDKNKKKNLIWAPDGNGMIYLDQDVNDPNNADQTKRNGNVVRWLAPFGPNDIEVIYSQPDKLDSYIKFSDDFKTIFLKETKSGYKILFAVRLDQPQEKYTITKTKSSMFYTDPGDIVTHPFIDDIILTSTDKNYVYLKGIKNYKDPMQNAPRPFLDKLAIENSKDKTRIFLSSPDIYQQVTAILDNEAAKLIISGQTAVQMPNSFLLDTESGSLKQLTKNIDYTPQITNTQHHRFQVTNVDGYTFWTDVYLPQNYSSDSPPPAVFWFYPSRYTDQKSYDRSKRSYNKNSFTRLRSLRSVMILTTLGYALVETDCPYFGTVNNKDFAYDSFIPEMRNNLWAVINQLDKRSFADRSRLAIGGHSFGAFGAANALMHTPFFKAAIAGDGAYNRTLTPNGFQSERRQFWDAKEMYLSVSALAWANQAQGALFMYHGQQDKNTGTWAIQTERLFQAMNTLGKTAAMNIYPYEDHGSESQQTILDLWARMIPWLDTYVKNYKQSENITVDISSPCAK